MNLANAIIGFVAFVMGIIAGDIPFTLMSLASAAGWFRCYCYEQT